MLSQNMLRGQGKRGDGAHWGLDCGTREHWDDKVSVLLWCIRILGTFGGQGKVRVHCRNGACVRLGCIGQG